HLSLGLPRSKGRDALINSAELSSFLAIDLLKSSLRPCSELEVEPTWTRRSPCSSKSQIETDRAPNVSEIRRAATVPSSVSSKAIERLRVNRVQIWRKSCCGLLKWRLMKSSRLCRTRSERSNTAKIATPRRTTKGAIGKLESTPKSGTTR